MSSRAPIRCIVPPGLLLRFAQSGDEGERTAALDTLEIDLTLRQKRVACAAAGQPALLAHQGLVGGTPGQPYRTIYDQRNRDVLVLGTVAWTEGNPPSRDPAVREAVTGFGATYELFWEAFARDSIDDEGMPLVGLVHFSRRYANAFWDGEGHMVFGDGDGQLFTRLTKSVDVIGHELTHGVTQYSANLAYQGQAGALNESISDVFGSLVRQYRDGETAAEADWLIGKEVVGPLLRPALRSLEAPGTANDFDDQVADMDRYVRTSADNGGVHINSGIPNRAFCVVATTIGGNAWEQAGHIWYEALRDPRTRPNTTFATFARTTLRLAEQLFGRTSAEASAVRAGWEAVKVRV